MVLSSSCLLVYLLFVRCSLLPEADIKISAGYIVTTAAVIKRPLGVSILYVMFRILGILPVARFTCSEKVHRPPA
jgi:hypothetical protein